METRIKFVHEDADQIRSEMKAYLESTLNRQIAAADIEMLLINAFAYRELILRTGINDAAGQNLVAFSRGAALEYLGQLVGVYRLASKPALTTIKLNLVNGHTGVVIPQGMRIQSTDGKAIFQIMDSVTVIPGVLSVEIGAGCMDLGIIGNGYEPNQINIILDPQSYLLNAQNITVTKGGSDIENDEDLRERIKLAPSSFSTAGPRDAYKYFAKSASSSISDVAVISKLPGVVNIYALLEGGNIPNPEILSAIFNICNSEKVRPLTDTVVVSPPTVQQYSIEVNLTLLTNAVNTNADSQVQNEITKWVASRRSRLGYDVVRNKIAALSMIAGVYNVEVVKPISDILADPNVYTSCTEIIVRIIGTHDD